MISGSCAAAESGRLPLGSGVPQAAPVKIAASESTAEGANDLVELAAVFLLVARHVLAQVADAQASELRMVATQRPLLCGEVTEQRHQLPATELEQRQPVVERQLRPPRDDCPTPLVEARPRKARPVDQE